MIFKTVQHSWDLSEKILIFGILNLTPDSFSENKILLLPTEALNRVKAMRDQGMDILDIGAESTRPGATPISLNEERDRLLPTLELLLRELDVPISVDTTKSEIAHEVLAMGAEIINDISGLRQDCNMAKVVSKSQAGLVLMHSRGTPQTMKSEANYSDLIGEIQSELGQSFSLALEAGVDSEHVMLDPGIGFAKTGKQNFELTARLRELQLHGRPVLYGPSRKSFIGEVTGKGPSDRLIGTVAAVTAGILAGAQAIRVHDVAEMKEAVLVASAVRKFC